VKKKILLGLFLGIIIGLFSVQAEESSFKKNISVVFDDSGSMAFDVRWAHANYALQTLVSLMDEGDILHIHYMNHSADDIALEIKKGQELNELLDVIRKKSVPDLLGAGETPIGSIKNGITNLSAADGLLKPNVIYDNWLVLITDGNEMSDDSGEKYANYVVDKTFDSGYKWVGVLDRQVANILKSTEIKYSTVILKIDDSNQDMLITSDMIGAPLIYKSAQVSEEFIQDKKIIQNMNDIATLISGRLEVETVKMQKNELVIQSNVPFYTLDILMQDSASKVSGIRDVDGEKIDVQIDFVPLNSPDDTVLGTKTLISDKNLYGSEIRITYKGEEALKSGEYTLEFEEDIESAKVTSFCFPAIQFIFDYYVSGVKVDKVFQEDRVSLEFIPIRSGTEEVIETLPENIVFAINLKCGNQFISFDGNTLRTNEFSIRSSTIEGNLTAEIPEIWLWSLNILENIDIAPETEKPGAREFSIEISQPNASVSYKEFENAEKVILIPKLNGERLSSDELKIGELSVVRIYNQNNELVNLDYSLEVVGDYYEFKPLYTGFKPNMPADTYKIEVKFTSKDHDGTPLFGFSEFTYSVGDSPIFIRYASYILTFLVVLALTVYLIGFIMKPRIDYKHYYFVKSYYDSIIDLDEPVKQEEFPLRVNVLKRFFTPFVREVGTSAELSLRAGKKPNHIYLAKESQKEGMVIEYFTLKGDLVGQRDLRLNLEQKLEYIELGKLITYQYTLKSTTKK